MSSSILSTITQRTAFSHKQLALLVDPDRLSLPQMELLSRHIAESTVDYIFVGGSLLTTGKMSECIRMLKAHTSLPIIIFPGNEMQIDDQADALLFLSLISGRNPEMLIGKHVVSAPALRKSGLEVIPTGYILVDGGCSTSVVYMSNTLPIPRNKKDIAVCTAIAGEMLGLKQIYLEAGSGAKETVTEEMIAAVKENISVPLIVGGGIKTPEMAKKIWSTGADIVVIGSAIEQSPFLLQEFSNVF